jgi:hypothetical protein
MLDADADRSGVDVWVRGVIKDDTRAASINSTSIEMSLHRRSYACVAILELVSVLSKAISEAIR